MLNPVQWFYDGTVGHTNNATDLFSSYYRSHIGEFSKGLHLTIHSYTQEGIPSKYTKKKKKSVKRDKSLF